MAEVFKPKTIILKNGLKANLPLSAISGEPLVTLDTGELFIGQGDSLPLRKVGYLDRIVETYAALLALTDTIEGKLYIVKQDENHYDSGAIYIKIGTEFQLIGSALSAKIDDSSVSNNTVWSSEKVKAELDKKVNSADKNQPNGFAGLDENGLISSNLIPKIFKEAIIVNDIPERDALTADVLFNGLHVLVKDASADETVELGYAEYVCVDDTNADPKLKWLKISEGESLDVQLDWSKINNRPTSSVESIDEAVSKMHNSNLLGTKSLDETGIDNRMVIAYNKTDDKLYYSKVDDLFDVIDGGTF